MDKNNKSKLLKDSKYQEQIIEYKFISELMSYLLFKNKKLEILRVHTDSFGYDLILKVDEKIRYVQLKSRIKYGRAQYWDVHKSLLRDDSGRVIIVFFSLENRKLSLTYSYLDLNKYDCTLKNTPKYKKDSEKYCCVCAKDLIRLNSIDELGKWLFGIQ